MFQRGTFIEPEHDPKKYEVRRLLRFTGAVEETEVPPNSMYSVGDLLRVVLKNYCGMGIDVRNERNGILDMVWPEEVEIVERLINTEEKREPMTTARSNEANDPIERCAQIDARGWSNRNPHCEVVEQVIVNHYHMSREKGYLGRAPHRPLGKIWEAYKTAFLAAISEMDDEQKMRRTHGKNGVHEMPSIRI